MTIPIVEIQRQKPPQTNHIFNVPSASTAIALPVTSGKVSLVIGPNGTGKSALAHLIYKSLPQGMAEFFPGHRQIYFSSDHFDFLGQPIDQLQVNLYGQNNASNRFRSAWSEDHLKSVVKRLTNDEFQYVWNIAESVRHGASFDPEKGPVAVLNTIFQSADIPVNFTIEAGQLRATRVRTH